MVHTDGNKEKDKTYLVCCTAVHTKIIPNYSEPIMKNRKEKSGGGVAIYVKNIPFKAFDIDFKNCELEACGITVFLRNEKLTIINLYDPDFQSFRVNDFENLLNQLNTKNYIITGDFNAHDPLWDKSTRDTKGKDLLNLNSYNLTILNDGTPTKTDFATAPDLTLATPEMSPHTTWNPINQSCGSDHLPILITLGVRYNATGTSNVSRWKLNKADWGLFKTLCEKNINMLSPQKDISTLSTNFTNQLMEICEKTIPKSKTGPKKKLRPPWWNQTCTNAIRSREKARKNTWETRPKKIRISIINLRLMLEKP